MNISILIIFLVFIFLLSSYKISGDDDFFWHLATGKYIVENKTVPDSDVFGYITAGNEWIPFEWGWDITAYTMFNIGGYGAVLIFRSVIICLFFLIYYMLLKKFRLNSLLIFISLLLLSASMLDRLSPRPHIVSYLFFVIILYLTLSYKYFNRGANIKKLYFLPLIFLIWCNIHMGVIAGGLYLFIFVLSELILYYKLDRRHRNKANNESLSNIKKLLIISAACLVVLLVNPHGINTYIYAYSHTKMKLLENVNEWQNPFTSKFDFGFIVTFYKVYLFLGLLVLFYAFRKKDFFAALIILCFGIYSIRAIRFTVDYEIFTAVFIAISLQFIIENFATKNILQVFKSKIPLYFFGVFIIFIIIQIPENQLYSKINYNRYFGFGINENFIPVKLFDFIKENKITGRPFNHFATGGYLIWNIPGEKNFIDSRNLNDEIFEKYNQVLLMKPGFENIIKSYDIDYFIYYDPDLVNRTSILPKTLTKYINTNPEWKLVYWDDKSMLYLKNNDKFSEIINKYHFEVLNPYNALFNSAEFKNNILSNVEKTQGEIERKGKTDPDGILYHAIKEMKEKILKN